MFDAYVGIPWRDRACGRDGCNCWGLVRLIYQAERGIELPAYSDRYATEADRAGVAAIVAGERSTWDEIGAAGALPFDLVLMRDGGFASHIGVVCGRGLVLHVFQGGASMIERLNSVAVRSRIVGFFRYRAP